jgi:two-component system sensor histidine kinase/response regulator
MNSTSTASASDSNPASGPRRIAYFPQPAAWVVLVIALLASAGGWLISWKHARLEARKNFDEAAMAITSTLRERMQIYQNVLHGAAGLFAASTSVDRSEWHNYIQSVSIEQRYPGVDAVGYVVNVPRDRLEEFVRAARADGAPDFEITDPGSEGDLLVVKYIEPMQRHRSSLGWNMAVDPERVGVAANARDSGIIALSGKVMVRDDVAGTHPGCLMMLPVYRHGMSIKTQDERRQAVEGWVFARFVMSRLMERVMDKGDHNLHVRIFDAGRDDERKLVFDNAPALTESVATREPWFESQLVASFGSRKWVLAFDTKPAFERSMRFGLSGWVAAGGGLISILLFMIAWSLGLTRERALAIASEMTGALRESNAKLQAEVQERQRSAAALNHSQSLYHSLVESLPLSITRRDLEGRLVFANQRYCVRNGKTLEDLIGKTDADLLPPDLAALRHEADRRAIETKETVELVERRVQPDGEVRFIQAIRTPLFDGGEQVIGVLGIFWDVTDNKRAETALKHERFLLRTLMDNLPDRIYFKDEKSRFLRNSRAHLQRFGLTEANEAIGKSDFDFFSDEHARQAYEDEQKLIRTGETVTKEEKETWPDGSITWALSTKMPLRDESGRVIGTFGISHDITDRKRAEEAMREAKESAEEASRAKSQFLASMSHELRTPLNSVIGFANILLKNKAGNLAASELNFLDRILANGKHLLGLINEILDLSKIEARKVEVQRIPLQLSELVRDTISQQESLVRDKPVKLQADIPAQLEPMMADGDKLKQVIINLIGNALKFTERGSVTVRVVTDPATRVPTRIDVVDTGIGIPEDKLGVIFQAFQQAEAGTARKYGGTGLGLTISQALCQLMGYRIEVKSEVGKGSTFSVYLTTDREAVPKIPVVPTYRISPSMAPEVEMKGRLVLVIDDELDSRTLLSHMVEEFGCQVISANSGEQGLRMAREFHPHLITVDLMMPHMDGWQVIRSLKADPELRDIPVVVVSIVAGENQGGIIGAVDVLQKPVIREDLLAALRRSIPLNKARILIVDDDADARHVLLAHLEDEAYECRQATNGKEALVAMEEFMPDLVFLDLMMPEMDGMTFLSHVRAEPRFQWMPVVVVTAKELTPEEAEQLRNTAHNVVKKGGVFEADLKRIMRRLLQRRQIPTAP